MIKVRFAPSPTGFLHIGGARTALFNWLYARSQKGVFLLRIEDTDLQRSKKEFEDEILDSMKWLGLDWDELEYQSKRFDIYKEYAQKLVSEGKAYKDGEAVLLKMTREPIKIYDLIRGEIDFDTSNFIARDENEQTILDENGNPQLRDEVLIKADGSPAYSFCCVIDDALMEISHVIRGEDHISNTPKQVLIYQALGFKPPKFAHLPLIMGEDGKRLSKRFNAVAVSDYRKEGFLPDALINYLMLLGWSPGNQEIVSLENAVKSFSIKKVNKAAAVFGMDKLKWVNNQYLKNESAENVVEYLKPFMQEAGLLKENLDEKKMLAASNLFKGRLSTLKDFIEWADFFFTDDYKEESGAREEHLGESHAQAFECIKKHFELLNEFDVKNVEEAFKNALSELELKTSDVVHPLRVALTGKAVGPSMMEIISILGKEKTLERLKKEIC